MTTFTIVYKSGAKVYFEADELIAHISKATNELVKLSWEKPKNKPLFIGVDNVAAVFVGKV